MFIVEILLKTKKLKEKIKITHDLPTEITHYILSIFFLGTDCFITLGHRYMYVCVQYDLNIS